VLVARQLWFTEAGVRIGHWTVQVASRGLAAAAVLGRRFDGPRLAAMVGLEGDAVVAALDLPLDTVVGHVLDRHRRGVTVVLTLDPAGCTVVTLIG
jgi:hypothetical protein